MRQMHVAHFSKVGAASGTWERVSAPRTATYEFKLVKSAETNWGAAGQHRSSSLPMETWLRMKHTVPHPQKHTFKSKNKDMRGSLPLLTLNKSSSDVLSVALDPVAQVVLELSSGSSCSKSDATRSLQICALGKTFAVLEAAERMRQVQSPTPDGSIPSFSAVHSHKQRKI